MTDTYKREKANLEAKARAKAFMYWGPVAVAPIPYVCVSLYRTAKTPQAKSLLVGVGMIAVPVATYATRVYLLSNADSTNDATKGHRNTITLEEQSRLGRF